MTGRNRDFHGRGRLGRSNVARQRGVALFIVLVFVLLSTLVALWASRTSLFNEMVVGNDTDYQRAFEAAQALLQDAELDIRGQQANGALCQHDMTKPKACRTGGDIEQFPLETQHVGAQIAALMNDDPTCKDGLCAKRTGKQDFWNDSDTLDAMQDDAVGARYGTYTGAVVEDEGSNPLLAISDGKDKGGWYWIEIMPYTAAAANSGLITDGGSRYLDFGILNPNVVYRITAVAHGRKPNTEVVLQQTYVRAVHNLDQPS